MQSQGLKISDLIREMTGRSRFDMKKIFDLPLEIILGEFLDQSDITIKKLVYNMYKITPYYRICKAKTWNTLSENLPAPSFNAISHPSPITSSTCDDDSLSNLLWLSRKFAILVFRKCC